MIAVENLTVGQGNFELRNIGFRVAKGEYAILMGKTGSGKTTLLEALCGLKKVRGGRIFLGGVDVTDWRPGRRGVGFVPQDGALFQTMTVEEHLSFALEIRGWKPTAIRGRVEEVAGQLGIGYLMKRTPHGLSGGECQRVALGRALSFGPSIVCFDEPFSALDQETRLEMCEVIRGIRKAGDLTVFHITHSMDEARGLADRLFRLKEGELVEEEISQAGGRNSLLM